VLLQQLHAPILEQNKTTMSPRRTPRVAIPIALLSVLICCCSHLQQLTAASAVQPAKKHQTAYIAFVNDVHNRLEEEEPLTANPCQPSESHSPAAAAAHNCVFTARQYKSTDGIAADATGASVQKYHQ
jgi:hypothetical protein